ncbi:MAG: 16S rRNA (cytidine(1402)-2'-O)-methyltransferase [Marinifilaceae bacterium]
MSKLYLVPTPVGNLEDITLRALRILKEVDLILAEDTRTTAKLLKHFEITTPLASHHKFNEHQQVERMAEKIAAGQTIALVSDAGTPGISDPGYLLTRCCIEKGIDTECLPGATAFVPALVNSGLPCDRFSFEGFLPQKKGRQKKLEGLAQETRTMIFYESPHRLVKALEQMSAVFGAERQACVAREISKMFEDFVRGTLEELITHFTEKGVKGEIVMIVSGAEEKTEKKRKYPRDEEEDEE